MILFIMLSFPKMSFFKDFSYLLVHFPPFIIIMLGNFYFIKLRLYISLFIHHLDKWIRFGNTIYSFLLKRKGREGWNSRGGGEVWKITWVNILKACVGLNFSQNLIAGGGWIRMTWLEKFEKLFSESGTSIRHQRVLFYFIFHRSKFR